MAASHHNNPPIDTAMIFGRQIRLDRERRTIRVMIGLYCRKHHDPEGDLCDECQDLFAYATERVDKCPYKSEKPACARCPIHCYKPAKREQVHRVMRYAGPRMIIHHPVLAILHYIDDMIRSWKAKDGPTRPAA